MSKRRLAAYWTAIAVLAYVSLAFLVFALRHPWMTDTERLINTWTALTFGMIDR